MTSASARAEPGKQAHGPFDVLVGDVPEHAARQHQVGRDGTEVGIRLRRVRGHDVDPMEVGVAGKGTCKSRIPGVELDQSGTNSLAPRMVGQDRQQIAPLAGTCAHDP